MNRLIRTGTLCILAALALAFAGCQNNGAYRKDLKWIADRAASLNGKINPTTGKPYTPEQALEAAREENSYAAQGAGRIVYGPLYDVVNSMSDYSGKPDHGPSIPSSMIAHPIPSVPTGHVDTSCATPHVH